MTRTSLFRKKNHFRWLIAFQQVFLARHLMQSFWNLFFFCWKNIHDELSAKKHISHVWIKNSPIQLTNNNHIAMIWNGLEWRCFSRHFTAVTASWWESYVVQHDLSVTRVVQLFDGRMRIRAHLRICSGQLTSTVIPFWSKTWAGGWSRGTYR